MTPRLLLLCFLVALLSTSAPAYNLIDNWATLAPNRLAGKVKTEPFATPWPSHLSLGDKGFIILGTGEFAQFSLLEITSTGDCTFIFLDSEKDAGHVQWRKVSFKVSPQTVAGLIADIDKSGVQNLKKQYVQIGVNDGNQALFSFSDGASVRTAWMDNSFPDEFRKILILASHLIDSQHLQLTQAPLSTREASRVLYHKAFPQGVK